MNYGLSLALRFLVAGSVIVGISVAAERLKNPMLASILMMMPSITLLSVYFIGSAEGSEAASRIVYGAIVTLPVWIAYAVSLYYFLGKTSLLEAIGLSFAVFLAGAVLLTIFRGNLLPS